MTDNRDSAAPTVTERVAAGVALLDEKRPGWDHRIDLDKLRMDDVFLDIVGQIFGGFSTGLRDLDLSDEQAAFHGFDVLPNDPPTTPVYEALTAEWRRVIAARRDQAVAR